MEQKRVPLEIKSLNEREFEGYGSVYGNVDLGGDVVAPGAFTKSLKRHQKENSMPLMFWMHDPALIPGAWQSISEDSRGLYVKGTLADTQLGNETRTLLGMKAVRGLSIGFSLSRDGADYDDDGMRVIKSADLWEVSIVSLPMNPRAQVTHAKTRLSAAGEYVPTARELGNVKRELETWLKSRGISKSRSTEIASEAFGAGGAILPAPVDYGATLASTDESDLANRLTGVTDAIVAAMIARKTSNLLRN
jgi:uncharacterized protein